MNVSRTLALVAPAAEEASSVPPDTKMLGLPIIRRTVLAARKAGFERVLVFGTSPDLPLARALEGTSAELLPSGSRPPEEATILPWNRVVDARALHELQTGAAHKEPGVVVRSASDLPRAESWLLSRLVKDTDGFMSRHFDRKISLALSRRLARTAVTPNEMTFVSVAIGLAGSPFFLSSRPALQTVGALLFVLHSIVDGCDGELARLKYAESRWGGLLDFWGDNLVHCAVFAAVAIGWSLPQREPWPLLFGAAAILGTVASAGFAYHETMRGPKEGPLFTNVTTSAGPGSKLVNALARRDFIYLVLALSLFGKANWFLVLAAVGAPAFFFTLLVLGRRPERKSSS
jgi:phosphatidylglycerophosphate synthase